MSHPVQQKLLFAYQAELFDQIELEHQSLELSSEQRYMAKLLALHSEPEPHGAKILLHPSPHNLLHQTCNCVVRSLRTRTQGSGAYSERRHVYRRLMIYMKEKVFISLLGIQM